MMSRFAHRCWVWMLGGVLAFAFRWAGPVCIAGESVAEVDYNRDIRPIFNKHCLVCHGGVKKSGGFSLLFEEEALGPTRSGEPAVRPGKPGESELMRRIASEDAEERMPAEGDALSPQSIAMIERWIAEGARWGRHWAYVRPERPSVPESVRGREIDYLVEVPLRERGLAFSTEADRATLLRRVSMDLTGLPPTLADVDSFLSDDTPGAYERVVDRLLASPRYGERWAALWLDLARYADTQGYEKDSGRVIWPYRDWVIRAFNRDLPYDQFTIEQLAGDLLPEATKEQVVATGFHRNTMTNTEGGTDDEEFRVAAVIDRVNTTWEVWMGTTFGCVQCHSHPYDPIRHEEYYRFMAFFNNTADADRGDDAPFIELEVEGQRSEPEAGDGGPQGAEVKVEAEAGGQSEPVPAAEGNAESDSESEAKAKRKRGPTTLVMRELEGDKRRKTRVFERGNWMVLGEEVQPAIPGIFGGLPGSGEQTRLDLARWMVSRENPLTARVMVNRVWEQLFGVGLVETLEDFGSQGEPPVNGPLLDWLAVEFQTTRGWSLKALLRQLVLSRTYRQCSKVSPELLERDPYNRWLARGPRFRLTAEMIRDQALQVAGLLSPKMYGPSVMPPQPDGVWQVVYSGEQWKTSEGEDRYRRAFYTYWRRTSPYPSMVTFDVPSREYCTPRRIRTNTPLGALATLNDPVYVEAARGLGQRMQVEGGDRLEDQIRHGFRLVQAREPIEADVAEMVSLYDNALGHVQADASAVGHLGASAEQAAFTVVANVLLNLDSTLTKD